MLRITRPEQKYPIIYSANLQYNKEAVHQRIIAQKNLKYEDFEALEGDLIEVGEPQCWNLCAIAKSSNFALSADIGNFDNKSDVWLIQFVFSIMPFFNNRVEWARLRVSLLCDNSPTLPIVVSIFPRRLRPETMRVVIGTNFQLLTEQQQGEPPLLEVLIDIDPNIRVTGAGLRGQAPSWDFQGDDVRGSFVTYAVVQKPPQTVMTAEFGFAARIKTNHGLLPASDSRLQMGGRNYIFPHL